MALIFPGKSECSICKTVLKENDELVMTTHFIADSNDLLCQYSDSGMHKSCFLKWEHRQDFIKKYNEIVGVITWGNGTYHHMKENGEICSLKRNI